MDIDHYFMLVVGITMQITKINDFYSIPEMILVITYPNSKLRSSLGLEIANKLGQFRTAFLDLNLAQKQN